MNAHKIKYEKVNAIEEKEERNRLFEISKVRGNFPQVFLKLEGKEEEFVGTYDKILELVELNSMDDATLEKNNLQNFLTVFAKAKDA